MMLNTALLTRQYQRLRAGHAPSLRELATRSWEVAPASSARARPAFRLPGDEDRVTGLSPWRNWPTERAMLDGQVIEHQASTAHLLEHVQVCRAFVYKGATRERHGFGDDAYTAYGLSQLHLKEAALASSEAGCAFFGTQLQYDFPLALLAQTHAAPFRLVTRPFSHAAAYRELCGLGDLPLVERAVIQRLTLFTDFAENASKAQRYAQLRSHLASALAGERVAPPSGVYIRRGLQGERRVLANEAEVEAHLAALGFSILDPDALTAREMSLACLGAPLVVSVEGSQISHAIFSMADDATLLVIQPPDRFSLSYQEYTDRMDMRFAFLVGEASEGGFVVAVDRVSRVLDMVTSSRDSR